MFILRQSTAVDVLIGPFVDGTDGVTTEEAVSPSVQLSKNGQTAATKNEGTTPAHDNAGYYNCVFDATDTGTVGTLVAFIEGSTATFLQVRHEFQIMDTAAFDALYADGAEGPLQATTVGNKLDVSVGGEAGIDWANIGSPTTAQNLSGTNIDVDQIVASVSGNVDGSVASVTAGVSLAAGAVTDASLAGGLEIVFETDFATNYNVTRNAWATNVQDFVGTSAADPFNGQVVAASVTGAVGSVAGNVDGSTASVTAGVTLANGAITNVSLAGNMEIVFETDFATNYNTTTNAWVTNGTDFIGTGWNVGKTGYSLTATTGLGNQTANITGNLSGSIGSNTELGPSEVNDQVSDVLKTDTIAERSSGAPTATPTFEEAMSYLYMMLTNIIDIDSGFKEFNNNAGTVIWKKALSDDTSNYVEGNGETGP